MAVADKRLELCHVCLDASHTRGSLVCGGCHENLYWTRMADGDRLYPDKRQHGKPKTGGLRTDAMEAAMVAAIDRKRERSA